LLRGINVGGQKKIKMAELRTRLEEVGFESVATYIQSGNVILESSLDVDSVAAGVTAAIEQSFGFSVSAAVRTAAELKRIVSAAPFERASMDADEKRHLVAFLSDVVDSSAADQFAPYLSEGDCVVAAGRELFIYLSGGQARSKLNTTLIETKLRISSTMRNWKTVKVLLELSR